MTDPRAFIPGDCRAAEGMPSVAVLVELVRGPLAGGHVKCWERFAEAAAALDPYDLGVDLTIYVLGERRETQRLSPTVRFVSLRPLISTSLFARRTGGADVADLAPFHPGLARLLPRHDVWHLTHTFAFAGTAESLIRRERRLGAPPGGRTGLVGSVHTDVPAVTAAYVRQLTSTLPAGLSAIVQWLPPHRSPDEVAEVLLRRRRDCLLRACDRVLVPTPSQRAEMASVVGADRVSLLGRGIDLERFRPDPSARAELARAHGVPMDVPTVLFVGRVDASKRVMLLAEAVRRLRDGGRAVHLVIAGGGSETGSVSRLLGRDATLLGPVSQDRLARVYQACDVFAFPSRTETIGNAVAEAMACRLPVVLPDGARTTRWLASPGQDGLTVRNDDPEGWAAALVRLVDQPALRAVVGARAAETSRDRHRSWGQVLTEDLVPVWRQVASRRTAKPLPDDMAPPLPTTTAEPLSADTVSGDGSSAEDRVDHRSERRSERRSEGMSDGLHEGPADGSPDGSPDRVSDGLPGGLPGGASRGGSGSNVGESSRFTTDGG